MHFLSLYDLFHDIGQRFGALATVIPTPVVSINLLGSELGAELMFKMGVPECMYSKNFPGIIPDLSDSASQ